MTIRVDKRNSRDKKKIPAPKLLPEISGLVEDLMGLLTDPTLLERVVRNRPASLRSDKLGRRSRGSPSSRSWTYASTPSGQESCRKACPCFAHAAHLSLALRIRTHVADGGAIGRRPLGLLPGRPPRGPRRPHSSNDLWDATHGAHAMAAPFSAAAGAAARWERVQLAMERGDIQPLMQHMARFGGRDANAARAAGLPARPTSAALGGAWASSNPLGPSLP